MAWNKPRPDIDQDMFPFWEGLKEHQLLLMRCKVCGAYYWPAAYCRFHENEPFFGSMEWVPTSGRGKVFSFGVTYQVFHPGFAGEVPFVYALIELDEGPMFGTRILDVEAGDVAVGMPVRIGFLDVPEEGFTLPMAYPVKAG